MQVLPVMEPFKISIHHRVVHRVPGGVIVQVSFCDIGLLVGIVDQHFIPGLVFGRARQRNLVVPLIRALKNRVDVNDNPPVIKQFMRDKLTNVEFGVL